LFTLTGCAIWCTALGVLGYDLGSSYNNVLKDFRDAGYLAGAIFGVVVVALFVHRFRAVRAEREWRLADEKVTGLFILRGDERRRGEP
jgi:membrane protein DedA with SNARE-associated domain